MSQAVVSRNGRSRYLISHMSSFVEMYVYEDILYLRCFGSGEREKGHGTEVLNMCRRIARKLNKPLALTAAPYAYKGVKPYDIERLKSYYEKRGFKVLRDYGRTCDMRYN